MGAYSVGLVALGEGGWGRAIRGVLGDGRRGPHCGSTRRCVPGVGGNSRCVLRLGVGWLGWLGRGRARGLHWLGDGATMMCEHIARYPK